MPDVATVLTRGAAFEPLFCVGPTVVSDDALHTLKTLEILSIRPGRCHPGREVAEARTTIAETDGEDRTEADDKDQQR
jgi:hypothetical protein